MSVRANLGDRSRVLGDRQLAVLRFLAKARGEEFVSFLDPTEAKIAGCLCRGKCPLATRAPNPAMEGRTVYRITADGRALLTRVTG